MKCTLWLLAATLLASTAAIAGTRVLDADTIDHHGERIRLHGIDAPESRQACLLPGGREWRCGEAATDALKAHIAGERIRLHGIDAPESRQACLLPGGREWRCGEAATDALKAHIAGRPVTCDALDIDRYGRTIGRCYVGDQDINRWLVSEGWAVAYRRFSLDYVADEDAARGAERGIWAAEFVMPWDWRRGDRIIEVGEQRPGCLIKGNINSRGERIYHMPGGQWYERTQIDPRKGQRWFCSPEEAEAAGWRRASR